MGGIMFNEDCTHFIYTRYLNGIDVSHKELEDFIDQYAGTQVKEFVMNVNAMLAFYPSKARENALDRYCKLNGKYSVQGNYAKTLIDIFVKNGLDMYGIWINRLRMHGISPWISIRTDDIHCGGEEDHFLFSDFFRDNKHLRRASHRPRSSYFDFALDYTYPEVREHNLSLIREVSERYDFDGLELDWMREPFSLGIGKEWDGKKIITDFMREVRNILDKAEKSRGHKIKMSARVPQSPEIALRFGFDTIDWARSGLVDVIIPTARFDTTDNDMPIDLWKQILSGTDVMLCAGLEIIVNAVRPGGKRRLLNSIETARGSAAAYLGMGAERIYLFNYFDVPNVDKGNALEVAGTAVDPVHYKELLTTVGELETATKLPRRHVVTYHDITAPGMKVADLLPFKCNPPGADGVYDFHEVRIVTGPVPEDKKISLVFGIDPADAPAVTDITVYFNGQRCLAIGDCTLPEPKPDCTFYSFTVEHDACFPEASIVEIASVRGSFTVEWLEIDVDTGAYA